MYYLKCIIYIVYLLLYLVLLFYSPQMSRACRHQWRNRCSAHPHTCPSHCGQTVEIVIFFFTILIKVVMNIKLHASPHTCPKGSCDLKDECNHLHWFENVLLSLFWSSAAPTSLAPSSSWWRRPCAGSRMSECVWGYLSRSVGCQRPQVLAVNWKVVLVMIFLQSLLLLSLLQSLLLLSLLQSLFCHCL